MNVVNQRLEQVLAILRVPHHTKRDMLASWKVTDVNIFKPPDNICAICVPAGS